MKRKHVICLRFALPKIQYIRLQYLRLPAKKTQSAAVYISCVFLEERSTRSMSIFLLPSDVLRMQLRFVSAPCRPTYQVLAEGLRYIK